jgi:transcriptional regulator with XRE-family HTH domain
MEEKYILGSRLRNFRKRAGMSQLQVEMAIGMSPGGLSRIENGEVNPLKETLYSISDVLQLTDQERSYLYGDIFHIASEDEINKALDIVKPYLDKKGVLAYLIDDRFRFIAISKTFQRILGFTDEQITKAKGRSFISVILSDEWGVKNILSEKAYYDIVRNLLSSLNSEVSFMFDDEIYSETIKSIVQLPEINKIWEEITKGEKLAYNKLDSRKVIFRLKGKDIVLYFHRDPLKTSRRFELIEYVPDSLLVSIFAKFF